MKTHKKITATERERLSDWKKEGLSNIDCAKRLGRSASTIGRELKRNRIRVSVGWNNWEMIYESTHADHVASARKKNAWFAKEPCEKTKKGGRKSQRVRIPDRVSIHDRPKEIETRTIFGHWEGDSIVGLGHRNGLHTEYERVCSLTRFERLKRITAGEAARAAQKIFAPLPDHAKRSTTLDNGSEHTDHKEFGVQAYFADPYSSWQRGGNENCNLWIRYYFPKGTDFSKISDEELSDVEWELNNRPRKRLNFKTPQEVFNQHLNILP